MTTNEHKLARALVAAHVDPDVAAIVLDTLDGWAETVEKAQAALEQQKQSDKDLQRFYTVRELRLLFKMSDSGVRSLIDSGVLAATRVGGSIRVPVEDVERFLAANTTRQDLPTPRGRTPRRTQSDEETLRRYPWLAE